jgi:phage portal protein BeeE/2'-5' RNA ligase
MFAQRIKSALQAFRNPTQPVKFFGGLSMGDSVYGGASGLTSRNRDLTFTEEGAATAFGIIVEVQRGVMFIADSIAMLPGGIYDSRTDELLVSLDTRQLDINKPGATFIRAMRQYERQWLHNLLDSIVFSDWLYGETFVLRLANQAGGVSGMRWLNPLYTNPMTNRGRIDHYDYGGDDGYFRLLPDSMAYRIHHRNPYDDLRGISPVLSALPSMNIGRNAERGVMSYFRNGMVLGGVMMPQSDSTMLSDPQKKRIEQDMKQHHEGVDNAFRWVIAPTLMSFETFDQPDLQKSYAVVKDASKKIMMALGVPPELAGNPDSVSYDNADKIMTNWLKVNGKAYANKIASYINTSLLPYFEPDASVYFKFDFTQVDRQDAALVQSDFNAGFIPMNVAQAQRGYEVDERVKDIYVIGGKPIHIDTLMRDARGVEETPGKIVYNQNGVAIPQGQVFQYHIDTGAVDTNEVRAGFGLPPKAAQQDDSLQRLQAQFTTMAAGVTAGLPPALVAQMVGLQLPPGVVPSVTVNPMGTPNLLTSGALPAEQPEPQKGAASLCVMLSLANNPDLIDLQKRLKVMYPDPSIKWNDPSDFHITMLYAPAIDDMQIDELVNVLPETSIEGLSLKVGSLHCFDNVGEHALHFRIARNSTLLDAQASLYDTCEAIGLQTSGYSRPGQYTPHITMGYMPEKIGRITFHGKISVTPDKVICSVERGGEDEIVYPLEDETVDIPSKAHDHHHNPDYVFEKALPVEEWRRKALKELKQALRRVREGKSFTPDLMKHTKHLISREDIPLFSPIDPSMFFDVLFARVRHDPLKATLARLDTAFTLKDFTGTKQEFEDEFLLSIADRKDGSITSSQLSSALNAVIDGLGRQAYLDGLTDGGVSDAELDDDDRESIGMLTLEAKGYVADFVSKFETYSDIQLDGKPREWAAGTLQKFYQRGLAAADANGTYIWRRGPTENGCEDCVRLDGTKARMKTWLKNGLLPQSQKLSCYGLNCLCTLENVRGGAKG